MLVDRVLRDLDLPDPEDQGGNPLRGSRLGRCARQSAMMLWPEAYPPEPLPARAKLVFRFGNMTHDMLRKEFRRVCPGTWGAEEMRAHFKVPLSTKDAKAALALIKSKNLRAVVMHGLAKRWDRYRLVLDTSEPALYVPLHVDGIADVGGRLASVEIKSMATGSFRRAVQGHVEYSYRVQMATAVDATGLDDAVYVAMRKDTSHALEVLYSRHEQSVVVTFTKRAQSIERIVTVENAATEGYEPAEWEAAEVRHPFEPHLVEQARERVRRILRATLTDLPEREYGPDFTCETCEGTGTQTKAKGTKEPLVKGPKPCRDCEPGDVLVGADYGQPHDFTKPNAAVLEMVGKPSGKRATADLPWNCRYCPTVTHCWPIAKLVIEDEKPRYVVNRREYEASGITYRGPE